MRLFRWLAACEGDACWWSAKVMESMLSPPTCEGDGVDAFFTSVDEAAAEYYAVSELSQLSQHSSAN